MLNFAYAFRFSFHDFLVSLAMWKLLLFFRWLASFWGSFFQFLRRTLYNTWKSQHQVLIMIFDKKAFVNISAISNSKKHKTFWILYQEFLLMNASERVYGIVLVLLLFRTIGKTIIKTLAFHNNTHLLDQS